MQHFFENAGFSTHVARRFLRQRPLSLRFIYLKIWLCLDWIAEGGFDALPATDATNDLLDQEHVLLATFFDGFLSNDKRANKAYTDINAILESSLQPTTDRQAR